MFQKLIIICSILSLISCSTKQTKETKEIGKDLNLKYEILSPKILFPNDNPEIISGLLIVDIPKGARYIDIAESIKNIGLKENLISAKIFTSMTGYLMEIDSVKMHKDEYYKSYLGHYDLMTKGLNWKKLFNANDIQFKGDMPIKINLKK